MIVIRVDTLNGLGHFMRCKWLAVELITLGNKVTLIADTEMPFSLRSGLQEILVLPKANTQRCDAKNCLRLIKAQHMAVEKVIVDNYHLNREWEAEMASHVPIVIAVDDIQREHFANLIIDSKWCGDSTQFLYKNKVSKPHAVFLGPKFAMLSPEYSKAPSVKRCKNHIMFSLGGGGDWSQLTIIIELLLKLAPQLKVVVIIGPNAVSTSGLQQLSKRFHQLNLISSATSLSLYYQSCSLFVGALGTSLYELAATKTPALTFSIAQNQENQQEALDDLGHYFHINDLLTREPERVVKLVLILLENIECLHKLRKSAAIDIDGKGASRVAKYITDERFISNVTEISNSQTAFEHQYIADNITIRKVTDRDINTYLAARNLPNNTWRMTITEKIDPIEHICWWFSNSRESFVIEDEGQPLLYIWHQLYKYENQSYLIGGWFAASDKVNFAHAQLALHWQLKETDKNHPDVTWLAVINKQNKFVNLLNQRAGFTSIKGDDVKIAATQFLFPNATDTEFNFVARGNAHE